jgi:GTP cyclohydrolase I
MEEDIREDLKMIENHISAIMDILKIPFTESNVDTPRRIAKMYYNELFKNRNDKNKIELDCCMKVFLNTNESLPDMIIERDIKFSSVCEHHWLPFSGTVDVGYIPKKYIFGLSKIPRVVKYFSKRPQLQEQLTSDIGKYLFNQVAPDMLFVRIRAEHSSVMCRGAEADCKTDTLYFDYDKDMHTIDEVLEERRYFLERLRG